MLPRPLAVIGSAVAGVAALSLAGCSSPSATAGPSRPPATSAGAFSGPWADEFADALGRTTSPKQRVILADGVVSSAEYAEAHADVTACLADSGYSISYHDGGGFDVQRTTGSTPDSESERLNSRVESCEREYDSDISFLYETTTRNPDNVDTRPAVVGCLVRERLVPPGYTVRDFDADNVDFSFPFDQFDPRGEACLTDPWGFWASSSS